MPRMTVCSADGCPELVPVRAGRCDAHARPAWQNTSRRNRERPRDWWKRRARVMRRDGKRCQWPGCSAAATEVDHRIPVAAGGSWDEDNLWSLCKPHHEEKTRAEKRSR